GRDEALARKALTEPQAPAPALAQTALPRAPGLYALHGDPEVWLALGLGRPPDERPLYVGKAEAGLATRVGARHVRSGRTGVSTVRRTLAALLSASGHLRLRAVPRRPEDPEPGRWSCFALESADEKVLTEWMLASLRLAFWASPPSARLRAVEKIIV